MNRIVTFSGKRVSPFAADSRDIEIIDIAHALSMLCRGGGHLHEFFSVARHSINCYSEAKARELPLRTRLACLLHDASEAYIADITRPVKELLPQYIEAEKRLQDLIYTKYLITPLSVEEEKNVQSIDDAMLYYELKHLLGETLPVEEPKLIRYPVLECNSIKETKTEFLHCFTEAELELKTGSM